MNDPQFDAALDRFTVPLPSADLAARIMAAAAQDRVSPALLPASLRRRDRRGPWRALIGVAAFGLMSATAAAAGLFGQMPIRIPVLTALVESAVGVPAEKPVALPKKRANKQAPNKSPPSVVVPEIKVPPLPERAASGPTPEERRIDRAKEVADRMERRVLAKEQRRAARGLPPQTEAQRQLIETLRNAKSDEERRTALRSIREAAQARRMARARRMGIEPPTPRVGAGGMTLEERMERRRLYRAAREKRLESLRALKDKDPAELRAQPDGEIPPPSETSATKAESQKAQCFERKNRDAAIFAAVYRRSSQRKDLS